MNENLKAFLDAIQNNEDLCKKAEEIDKKSQEELKGHVDEFIALAKEYGFELTEKDLAPDNSEMTDEELEAVAGGNAMGCAVLGEQVGGVSDCFCAFIGAGTGDSKCGCAIGGGGK